jgi:predicted helicase
MSQYIYIRTHESYNKYDACKLGITSNIPDRDLQYATGEITRGKFILVIEIFNCNVNIIEKMLHNYFSNFHVLLDGGIEFYKKNIIDLIVPYLNKLKINFKVLSESDINKLTRKYRINIKNLINYLKIHIIPFEHQLNVLNKIKIFYGNNNIGKLIWACGLGKALLSILCVKELNSKLILIGVPSIFLQKQFKKEILKIFSNKSNILCVGGNEDKYKKKIKNFLNNQSEPKFIITTYSSCHLLLNIPFDFKIGDEAHHLVGITDEKIADSYKLFHKIKATKTLFMTATEKITNYETNKTKYSMDDETLFGKYIDCKTINWAIEHKKITDYDLLILKNTIEEVDDIIKSININVENKELFLSAYMTLKTMTDYKDFTHVLIFANSITNAELIQKFINIILEKKIFTIKDIYVNSLHSKTQNNFSEEIRKFSNSNFGIISCVYIFGEGFDLPILNGVVFAENMESDIRIVQNSLRPNRLDVNNPNKRAKIIIPYIDNKDETCKYFSKLKNIIGTIRNVDENVVQKIHIITNKKNKECKKDKKHVTETEIDNKEELERIKIKLIHSKTLLSGLSEEQEEYNYIKELNKENNIKTKEEYIKCNTKYTQDYFQKNGVWTNWYDFLGINTDKFLSTKSLWVSFCEEHDVQSLEDYDELCKKYNCLPVIPSDFYKFFTNILNELKYIGSRHK